MTQYFTLEQHERTQLEQAFKSSLTKRTVLFIAGIIFWIASVMVISLAFNWNVLMSSVIAIGIATGVATLYFTQNKAFSCMRKDLRKNEKKVVKGRLKRKYYNIEQNAYLFYLEGNTYKVSKREFDSFSDGDLLEFHCSPFFRFIFRVEKMEFNVRPTVLSWPSSRNASPSEANDHQFQSASIA